MREFKAPDKVYVVVSNCVDVDILEYNIVEYNFKLINNEIVLMSVKAESEDKLINRYFNISDIGTWFFFSQEEALSKQEKTRKERKLEE